MNIFTENVFTAEEQKIIDNLVAKYAKDGEDVRADVEAEILNTRMVKTLRRGRVKAGLTCKEVAQRMGVSPSKISRMESAYDSELAYKDIVAYANAVGLEANLVFSQKQAKPDLSASVLACAKTLDELLSLVKEKKFKRMTEHYRSQYLLKLLTDASQPHAMA